MKNIWTVASHEFLSNIKKPSFLFAVFGAPLLSIGLVVLVTLVSASSVGEGDVTVEAMGYVDRSVNQLLADPVDVPEGWLPYETVDAARAALDAEELDAFFALPGAYMQTGTVQLYAFGSVSEDVLDAIEIFLGANVAVQVDSDVSDELLRDPVDLNIYLENNQRELSQEGILGLFLVPLVFALVLLMSIQLTSNFLMSSVVEEKTNRIMEILLTTVTPMQLLTGKILGLGALGLLQLVVWVGVGAIGLSFGSDNPFISSIVIPADMVIMAFVYFILTYFLYGSLLAGVGAIADSEQESRSLAGVFSFGFVIPFFLIIQFLLDPDGTIPVFLSVFPLTSGISMMMRLSFGTVTAIELAASIGLLVGATVLVVWASAKVFRWAILLYGKKITPREIWRVIRGNPQIGVLPAAKEQTS